METKDIEIPVDFPLDEEGNEELQRISVPTLDALLGKKIPVLNHGFIRLIDYMGNDSSITQSARISYGQGTKTILEDEGLIDFLMRHKHTSPFEMCEIKLHVKMPISIARQWLRHRTANVNEISARYSAIKSEFFLPEKEDVRSQSKQNKQSSDESLSDESAAAIIDMMNTSCQNSFSTYEQTLNNGLAREIARFVLPQGTYTEVYWKIDLHNLLHFLKLRMAKGAQKEIRVYAQIILDTFVKPWVPMVYKAFMNHQINGINLSGTQLQHIVQLLDMSKVQDFIAQGKSKRGQERELVTLLQDLSNRSNAQSE